MKLKFYTRLGLALSALLLAIIPIIAVKNTKENSKNERQPEHESAAAYIAWRTRILVNQVTGTVDPIEIARIDREIALRNSSLSKTNAGMDWTELGPNNVGGRTRSILIDRANSNLVFAGSVSGGIWKSTTAGSSWTRVNDMMSNLNICCLAQTSNGNIYAGTGEGSFARDGSNTRGTPGFNGTGIFKSTDAGVTFTLLSSTDATQSGKSMWINTNDMKADPTNPDRIYAGNTNGLYITSDGGASWTKANSIPPVSGNCIDIDISKDGNVIAAVIGTSIYISVDAGVSFNRLTPTNTVWGGTPGRISLAIANSNSNFIYAMAANASTNRTLSIVQSKDKGQTWTRIVTGSTPYVDILGNDLLGQGDYDNVTAVDPDDAEHAYFGGVDLWDWTPTAGIAPISLSFASITSPKYVHSDNHAIVWDLKTTPATMYIGNDGGVFKSLDKGKNFYASNHGYAVTQFYAVTAAYIKDDIRNNWVVAGGSQDNGTWVIDGLGNTFQSGIKTKGGDGFYAELSQKVPGYAIFSTYDSDLSSFLKFISRDNDFSQKYDQTFYNDRVAAFCKDSGVFNTPFMLWETPTHDSISMFLFAAKGAAWLAKDIYQDLSKVPAWYRVMNFNGEGTCVDISTDGNTALIGTNNGAVYKVDSIRTKGIFDSVSATLSNVNISLVFTAPGRYVNGVSFCKSDKNKAVVTLGNYGNTEYVYYSSNLNSPTPAFPPIQGNLPKIPVYDAEFLWDDPSVLVLGTEKGIYVSRNFSTGTPTYTSENNGMANVPVFQIRQYKFNNWKGSRFYIATHGRGFYQSTTYAHTGISQAKEDQNTLGIFPNPAKTTVTLSFDAKLSSKARISLYSMTGQLIKTEEISTTSGRNNYGFYVDVIPNGNYITVVNHDGIIESLKLIIAR